MQHTCIYGSAKSFYILASLTWFAPQVEAPQVEAPQVEAPQVEAR